MSQPNTGKLSTEETIATMGKGAALIKNPSMPWKQKAVVVLSVLVLISPLDFIPEAIFGPIGLIDDAGLAVWSSAILFARHTANKKLASAQVEKPGQGALHVSA